MNEVTEKNINEAIDWLQKTGGTIQDFAAEQMPLYCREVVAWQFWMGVTLSVFCLMAIFAAIRILSEARRLEAKGGDGFPWAMPAGFIILFAVPTLVAFCAQAVKAVVAPRVVIVEHLRGLVK